MSHETEGESEDVEYQIVSGGRVARWAFIWAVFAGLLSLFAGELGVVFAALLLALPYLAMRSGDDNSESGPVSAAEADPGDESDSYDYW